MAEIKDIILKVDSFFKETRIIKCENQDCRHLGINKALDGSFDCTLKKIFIDDLGKCGYFEEKED